MKTVATKVDGGWSIKRVRRSGRRLSPRGGHAARGSAPHRSGRHPARATGNHPSSCATPRADGRPRHADPQARHAASPRQLPRSTFNDVLRARCKRDRRARPGAWAAAVETLKQRGGIMGRRAVLRARLAGRARGHAHLRHRPHRVQEADRPVPSRPAHDRQPPRWASTARSCWTYPRRGGCKLNGRPCGVVEATTAKVMASEGGWWKAADGRHPESSAATATRLEYDMAALTGANMRPLPDRADQQTRWAANYIGREPRAFPRSF